MFLMLFTHYLFGYVGKEDICIKEFLISILFKGTILCSIGLVLALCSVYIFTRRQMVSSFTVKTFISMNIFNSNSVVLSRLI